MRYFDLDDYMRCHLQATDDGHWSFSSALRPDGYATAWWEGKSYLAHRLVWEWWYGESVAVGKELDHLCRLKWCVNPHHLEGVIHQENCARGDAGLYNHVKTVCDSGHPLEGDNVYRYTHGKYQKRGCRACREETWRLHGDLRKVNRKVVA